MCRRRRLLERVHDMIRLIISISPELITQPPQPLLSLSMKKGVRRKGQFISAVPFDRSRCARIDAIFSKTWVHRELGLRTWPSALLFGDRAGRASRAEAVWVFKKCCRRKCEIASRMMRSLEACKLSWPPAPETGRDAMPAGKSTIPVISRSLFAVSRGLAFFSQKRGSIRRGR